MEVATGSKTMAWERVSFALFWLFYVLICPLVLIGQSNDQLTGKVQGISGVLLAAVKITLVNEETQSKEQTSTTQDGNFVFGQVVPGNYLLQVDAKGFEPYRMAIQVGATPISSLKIKL